MRSPDRGRSQRGNGHSVSIPTDPRLQARRAFSIASGRLPDGSIWRCRSGETQFSAAGDRAMPSCRWSRNAAWTSRHRVAAGRSRQENRIAETFAKGVIARRDVRQFNEIRENPSSRSPDGQGRVLANMSQECVPRSMPSSLQRIVMRRPGRIEPKQYGPGENLARGQQMLGSNSIMTRQVEGAGWRSIPASSGCADSSTARARLSAGQVRPVAMVKEFDGALPQLTSRGKLRQIVIIC